MQTKTITYNCIQGTIANASVTPNVTDANTNALYTITFQITNPLTTGSFIEIQFPSELTLSTPTASCNLTPQNCTVINSNSIIINLNSPLPADSILNITIDPVLNAP
jgi:hypothetical protein